MHCRDAMTAGLGTAVDAELAMLWDDAPIELVGVDGTGTIAYANRRFLEQIGQPCRSVLGRSWAQFCSDEDDACEFLLEAQAHRRSVRETTLLRAPEGRARAVCIDGHHSTWGSWTWIFIRPKGAVAQEERLTRMEAKNRELEDFAHAVVNNLREPLRQVRSFASKIAARGLTGMDRRLDEDVRSVAGGARRAQEMLDGLVTYLRAGRGPVEIEGVDVRAAIDVAVEGLRRSLAEVDAVIELDELPSVTANRGHLATVFHNILENAIKFRGKDRLRIEIRARTTAECAWVDVADNGVGFEPHYAEEVFLPFRRLDPTVEGSGLGLALCRKLVEQCGGRVVADSAPRRGTTLSIALPLN